MGSPSAPVTSFKYLERVLSAADDDWIAMVHNLQRTHHKWAWLFRVLIREGEDARTPGKIYGVVVQAVILYRSETWVMKPHIRRVMGGFHHSVARRLMGRQPPRGQDGGGVYPPPEAAMVDAGFQEVETHASCRHNTVTQLITTRPIMVLCLAAARRPGSRVAKR